MSLGAHLVELRNRLLISAIAIAVVMMAFTFLGDGLRDALDPRMRREG